MKMEGTRTIAASRETVWAALNDPDVLRACVPGCESLESTGENGFDAVVKQKVGPVSATFKGSVELTNINPPESYTISGQGTGGAAGFAKGGADVALTEEGPEQTRLDYTVDAQVGGKLAQIGSRLINSFAKKMADQFFDRFAEAVEGPAEEPADTAATDETAEATPEGEKKSLWKRIVG